MGKIQIEEIVDTEFYINDQLFYIKIPVIYEGKESSEEIYEDFLEREGVGQDYRNLVREIEGKVNNVMDNATKGNKEIIERVSESIEDSYAKLERLSKEIKVLEDTFGKKSKYVREKEQEYELTKHSIKGKEGGLKEVANQNKFLVKDLEITLQHYLFINKELYPNVDISIVEYGINVCLTTVKEENIYERTKKLLEDLNNPYSKMINFNEKLQEYLEKRDWKPLEDVLKIPNEPSKKYLSLLNLEGVDKIEMDDFWGSFAPLIRKSRGAR